MEATINYLSNFQSFNLSYYLNKPNKGGLGVIYARFRIGGKLYRISTKLRTKKEYWDQSMGDIRIKRDSVSRGDWVIYSAIQKELNSLSNVVGEKIEYYICDSNNSISPVSVGDEIAKLINSNFGMEKKKTAAPKSLISLLKGIVLDYEDSKSQSTFMGIVSTFDKFMTETGVKDDISSLNMDLMRGWQEWLVKEKKTVKRINCCVDMLFRWAKNLEQKYGYDFKLDKDKIEPIKDKRSIEERRNNGIALTPEEIDKIRNLDLTGKKRLVVARDMFLLQCWCGNRIEDFPLLLDSKNISKHKDGVYYSEFNNQKTKTNCITPLNSLYPMAWELVKRYKDNCPYNTKSQFNDYNRLIKQIATLAGLDREITKVEQKGKDKVTKVYKLYDKISSHVGRHTFITNCIREKGLTPDKIKIISGHSDTQMIENTYTNLTKEDNREILSKAVEEAKGFTKTEAKNEHRDNLSRGDNSGLGDSGVKSPVKFALWLLTELGISKDSDKIPLSELFDKIKEGKQAIISKYGQQRYEDIKKFIGISLGDIDKKRLEVLFCKALKHPVKIVGNIRGVRL